MRATLHDELMREAGFETDYDRELQRHRERGRRSVVRPAVFSAWLRRRVRREREAGG